MARHAWFLGPRTDIPDLVNAADATIHASTMPEPFGIVLVEGMALGKVVLASDAGGPREIFTEGTGYLHDPQDPTHLARGLERLVSDPAWRVAVGARALARAQTFDVSHMAGKIESVYTRVLGA
jgi:glycosyltransferase involved in cell wall biosynthesis